MEKAAYMIHAIAVGCMSMSKMRRADCGLLKKYTDHCDDSESTRACGMQVFRGTQI